MNTQVLSQGGIGEKVTDINYFKKLRDQKLTIYYVKLNAEMLRLIIVIIGKEEQLDFWQLWFSQISVREIYRAKENKIPGRSLGEFIGK